MRVLDGRIGGRRGALDDAVVPRRRRPIEQATVACLRIDLYTMTRSERPRGRRRSRVSPTVSASNGRRIRQKRMRGANMSASGPCSAAARSRSSFDLPLMSDPAVACHDSMCSPRIVPAALTTDANLSSLAICRAVNLSLEHGNSDASCYAYVELATVHCRTVFRRLPGRLSVRPAGYDLVEQRGIAALRSQRHIWCAAIRHAVEPAHVRAGSSIWSVAP